MGSSGSPQEGTSTAKTTARGKIFVWGCLTVLVISVIGAVFLFSSAFWAMRWTDYRAGSNLKSWAYAFRMYAQEQGGYCPVLSAEPGRLMFEVDGFYPEYCPFPEALLSVADPLADEIDFSECDAAFFYENSSYFYMGYEVWNDEVVEAFARAYRKRVREGLGFDEDLPVDLQQGEFRAEKLTRQDYGGWEGPTKYLTFFESEIPLLIERPHPYPGSRGLYVLFFWVPLSKPEMGGTVLYQDGHVEFIPYPGKWPMTERTISLLAELSKLRY